MCHIFIPLLPFPALFALLITVLNEPTEVAFESISALASVDNVGAGSAAFLYSSMTRCLAATASAGRYLDEFTFRFNRQRCLASGQLENLAGFAATLFTFQIRAVYFLTSFCFVSTYRQSPMRPR